MGKLWTDPCSPLASNCIYKNMTLRHLSVWLTHTLHCRMKKNPPGSNPLTPGLTVKRNVIAMIHDLHALLWFQSHLSPFAAHPTTTPRMPAPNTSLPAKYVGRQVIQGKRGLRPCRESQWDLRHCPSQSVAAQQYSNNSLQPAADIVVSFSLRVIFFGHMDSGKHFLLLYVEVHFYFFLRMEENVTRELWLFPF